MMKVIFVWFLTEREKYLKGFNVRYRMLVIVYSLYGHSSYFVQEMCAVF